MSERVINKVTSTSGNLPPVLLDLTSDTVNERNLERDQTAHNSGGQKITGQLAIEDAEAWARGTRNGTPVPSTDETYQNNSLYYSIVSGSIMQMAGQKAIAAATSANNAAESERAAGISESNAANSERAAENSAIVSGSCMNIAGVHAGDAEAWAIGKRNGQLVPPTDPTYENNSLHYKEVCESIAGSLASVLKPKGTCLFVNLPTIADSQPGDTWNIEDEFTTTSDFREGAGRIVEAGANVYLTIDLKWDVLAGTTSDYIGATASTAAVHGLVPPAQAGDQNKVLYGKGQWDNLPVFRGVSGSMESISGMLPPAPQDGEDLVFKGNGQWGMGGNDALIAPVEKTSIATNAYAIGEQFVYGGILCKAIATINQGDTFTLGTNYQLANDITTQIKAIVDSYVTGIKGNAESSYRKGNVNLTPANIGLTDNSVKDYNNNTPTKFGYSTSGMARADATWLGAWDTSVSGEYRLRAVKQADLNVNYAASAGDSSKLNGYASDTAASKNTIVRRNSSGYVYATYFNQSSAEESSATNARPAIIDGSGWLRKFTAEAGRSTLGLGGAATYGATTSVGNNSNLITASGVYNAFNSLVNYFSPATYVTGGGTATFTGNINTINIYHGYFLSCTNACSGTKPNTAAEFLLIGRSQYKSGSYWGIQIAITLNTTDVYIRRAPYSTSSMSWTAWRAI